VIVAIFPKQTFRLSAKKAHAHMLPFFSQIAQKIREDEDQNPSTERPFWIM